MLEDPQDPAFFAGKSGGSPPGRHCSIQISRSRRINAVGHSCSSHTTRSAPWPESRGPEDSGVLSRGMGDEG